MAFPQFVLDSVILGDVAAQQKQNAGALALPAFWAVVVAQQHQAATDLIYTRLVGRGYTPAQIAGWDLGAEVERQIALYLSLVSAGCLEDSDSHLLEKYESYTEPEKGLLARTILTVGTKWQSPGDTPGTVEGGGPRHHGHWHRDEYGLEW